MIPDFGSIFGVPLVNDRVTSFVYVPPSGKTMKALLVSDCHLGAYVQIDVAINLLIDSINALIESENATVLFILGDLVDGTQNEVVYKNVLQELTKITIPVYVIGGNHDREFLSLTKWPSGTNVTVTEALTIQMTASLPGKPDIKVFLAHDLLNNYRVRDPHAFFFIDWIKKGCRKYIKPEDWLITGHTHTGLISHASRIACVGQFSPEIKAFGYATLQFNADLVFSIKNSLKAGQ